MAVRVFEGLGQFARFLAETTADIIPAQRAGLSLLESILYKNVREMYGDHRLAPLAQATKDDRVAKGYTPDDPLLRDGSLLRDSLKSVQGTDFVAVGSNEPVAEYHEYGYFNVRAGKAVPPRPVFREGLRESIPRATEVLEDVLAIQVGVKPISARAVELM